MPTKQQAKAARLGIKWGGKNRSELAKAIAKKEGRSTSPRKKKNVTKKKAKAKAKPKKKTTTTKRTKTTKKTSAKKKTSRKKNTSTKEKAKVTTTKKKKPDGMFIGMLKGF